MQRCRHQPRLQQQLPRHVPNASQPADPAPSACFCASPAAVRAQGMDADSPTGSALIISLCQANQVRVPWYGVCNGMCIVGYQAGTLYPAACTLALAWCSHPLRVLCSFLQEEVAETVYNDMLALAWHRQRGHLPAPAASRGGLSNTAQLPDTEAMACLVQVGGVEVIKKWGLSKRAGHCTAWHGLFCAFRLLRDAAARHFSKVMLCPACWSQAVPLCYAHRPSQAFAASGQMRSAAKFYKQLRRSGPKSLAGAGRSQLPEMRRKAMRAAGMCLCLSCKQRGSPLRGSRFLCLSCHALSRTHAPRPRLNVSCRCDPEPPPHVGAAR